MWALSHANPRRSVCLLGDSLVAVGNNYCRVCALPATYQEDAVCNRMISAILHQNSRIRLPSVSNWEGRLPALTVLLQRDLTNIVKPQFGQSCMEHRNHICPYR